MTNSKHTAALGQLWLTVGLCCFVIIACMFLLADVRSQQRLHREQMRDLRNAVYGYSGTNIHLKGNIITNINPWK